MSSLLSMEKYSAVSWSALTYEEITIKKYDGAKKLLQLTPFSPRWFLTVGISFFPPGSSCLNQLSSSERFSKCKITFGRKVHGEHWDHVGIQWLSHLVMERIFHFYYNLKHQNCSRILVSLACVRCS